MGLDKRKRLEDLERRFGVDNVVEIQVVQGNGTKAEAEPLYSFLLTPSGQRFGESFERDFERSLQYARSRVEEGRVSRADLEGSSPMTIAAVYSVLASRGDRRAEEVRRLYEDVREDRRHHYASRGPKAAEEVDRFFGDMVERHAREKAEEQA